MTSPNLDNLVKAKQLKPEPPDRAEFEGLVHSGRVRLADAARRENSLQSRFDLAYNAAHALALAALRRQGYRSENRYTVFLCLPHTLGLAAEQWRVLELAHKKRNAAEYAGLLEIDEPLLADMLRIAQILLEKLDALGPPA